MSNNNEQVTDLALEIFRKFINLEDAQTYHVLVALNFARLYLCCNDFIKQTDALFKLQANNLKQLITHLIFIKETTRLLSWLIENAEKPLATFLDEKDYLVDKIETKNSKEKNNNKIYSSQDYQEFQKRLNLIFTSVSKNKEMNALVSDHLHDIYQECSDFVQKIDQIIKIEVNRDKLLDNLLDIQVGFYDHIYPHHIRDFFEIEDNYVSPGLISSIPNLLMQISPEKNE